MIENKHLAVKENPDKTFYSNDGGLYYFGSLLLYNVLVA